MSRTLSAALACRVQGTRLYAKPLQNLEPGYSIVEHILTCIAATPEIDSAVLGISEGVENLPFVDIAKRHGAAYIIGDQRDVLWRLIQCGRAAGASDLFRVTTECPFTMWEMVGDAWRLHLEHRNDITVLDRLPEGTHFEIYTLAALERCHRNGTDEDRSEYASNYARRHRNEFKVEAVPCGARYERMDLRLTVDYPEDLVLCRQVYAALKHLGPRIPLADIIGWLDEHEAEASLVRPYTVAAPLWTASA